MVWRISCPGAGDSRPLRSPRRGNVGVGSRMRPSRTIFNTHDIVNPGRSPDSGSADKLVDPARIRSVGRARRRCGRLARLSRRAPPVSTPPSRDPIFSVTGTAVRRRSDGFRHCFNNGRQTPVPGASACRRGVREVNSSNTFWLRIAAGSAASTSTTRQHHIGAFGRQRLDEIAHRELKRRGRQEVPSDPEFTTRACDGKDG